MTLDGRIRQLAFKAKGSTSLAKAFIEVMQLVLPSHYEIMSSELQPTVRFRNSIFVFHRCNILGHIESKLASFVWKIGLRADENMTTKANKSKCNLPRVILL